MGCHARAIVLSRQNNVKCECETKVTARGLRDLEFGTSIAVIVKKGVYHLLKCMHVVSRARAEYEPWLAWQKSWHFEENKQSALVFQRPCGIIRMYFPLPPYPRSSRDKTFSRRRKKKSKRSGVCEGYRARAAMEKK
jgi:hypothetical protein